MRIRLAGPRSSSTGGGSVFGRIFISLFFLFFAALGGLGSVLILNSVTESAQTRRWLATPCTILDSRGQPPEGTDHDYSFLVRYEYAVDGERYESDTFRRGYGGSDDYSEIQRLIMQYPPGAAATCYIDPQQPSQAVLQHNSRWELLFVPLPLIFVAVGVGGLIFTWRGGSQPPATVPLAKTASTKNTGCIVPFICLFVMLLGGVMTYMLLVRPVARVAAAGGWIQVPCTIVNSRVLTHRGDDSTTYSVDIFYRYEIDGREYHANRYDFVVGSSSGYSGKQEIANRYPPGTEALCYVNPADPAEAVLERGFTGTMLFGLIPLLFLLGGGGGLIAFVRYKRRGAERPGQSIARSALLASAPAAAKLTASPLDPAPRELRVKQSLVLRLVAVIAIALFWNGIISIFVWEVIDGFRRGSPDLCSTLFMIPFVLVGLGLIGGIGYTFLALFNPRVKLVLTPGELTLGSRADLTWEFSGRVDRIHQLSIDLEGAEHATYGRGTKTTTDKHVFMKIPIVETSIAYEIAAGVTSFDVPQTTMHTFTSPNNKITWTLMVRGEIARWPDVKEEFELTIHPLPLYAAQEHVE
jgi:hypothetical protein